MGQTPPFEKACPRLVEVGKLGGIFIHVKSLWVLLYLRKDNLKMVKNYEALKICCL